MVLLEMVFPSFPVTTPVENKIVPKVAPVPEPAMVQLVMVLLQASFARVMVEAVAVVLEF